MEPPRKPRSSDSNHPALAASSPPPVANPVCSNPLSCGQDLFIVTVSLVSLCPEMNHLTALRLLRVLRPLRLLSRIEGMKVIFSFFTEAWQDIFNVTGVVLFFQTVRERAQSSTTHLRSKSKPVLNIAASKQINHLSLLLSPLRPTYLPTGLCRFGHGAFYGHLRLMHQLVHHNTRRMLRDKARVSVADGARRTPSAS